VSSVLTAAEHFVSRVQRWRFEEQERVEFRRHRSASERVAMAQAGVFTYGSRPTAA
jgi:hypothetical protein